MFRVRAENLDDYPVHFFYSLSDGVGEISFTHPITKLNSIQQYISQVSD